MSAHPNVETLSSFLDRELDRQAQRRVTDHLENCAECRATLAGLRRVVGHLHGLERLDPPAHLGMQVRRLAALQPPRSGLFERLERGVEKVNLQSTLLPVFAIVLALVVIAYLLSLGVHRESSARIPVILDPESATVDSTESASRRRIGDRNFVLQGEIWIEEGLIDVEPVTTLDSSDDRFERWLAAWPAMRALGELGSRVRLEIDGQVLEIRFDEG